jgi:hypothetical protein
MDNHGSAREILRRAVLGASPLEAGELQWALDHVASCEMCSREFEVSGSRALTGGGKEAVEMTRLLIDPDAVFEEALVAALLEPEAVVRRRAAERLGESGHLGAEAVAALTAVARGDKDDRVRAAALAALSECGAGESVQGEQLGVRLAINGVPLALDNLSGMPEVASSTRAKSGVQVERSGPPGAFVESEQPPSERANVTRPKKRRKKL